MKWPVIVGVAVLILLAAYFGSRVLFAPEPAPGEALRVAEASTEADELRPVVREIAGRVERGAPGDWQPVQAGAQLRAHEALRTGPASRATVGVGTASLTLAPDSRVAIGKASGQLAEVTVGEGRVSVDVPEGGPRMRVGAEGTSATAESAQGRFTVYADGRGAIAVATETGEVKLSGAGRTVSIGAGRQAQVGPDGTPTAAEAVPASVFLKVAWPEKRITAKPTITLRGEASPGTRLLVNGAAAIADRDGVFVVQVALTDGPNTVEVAAEDLLGRTKVVRSPVVTVDRRPPPIDPAGDPVWKK